MTESQRWRRVLAVSAAGVLVAASASTTAYAEPTSDALIEDKVDTAILAEIDAEGEAELWVRFQGSPDYSEAFGADTKVDKGTAAVAAAKEFAESSQADVIAILEENDVDFESYWGASTIQVTGGTDLLAELAVLDDVTSIVEAPEYALIEPVEMDDVEPAATEWGIENINAPAVWDLGYDGTGVTIASIDTGVDYEHPALVEQYRGNNGDGTFTHDYNFFDVQDCGGEPCDTDIEGHGTHTMGTMVGDDGGDNQIGVAPGAEWIAVNACCPSLEALLEAGEWIAAPTDSEGDNPDVSMAPDVVNNSWGTTASVDDPFYEDIVAMWHAVGIIPVFAAGNNGPSCETGGSPGLYPNVIGVGAHDIDNNIAALSARGPGRDGQVKPDITAPGINVRSSLPGGGYDSYNGTSMAAPHVTGMIALMISAAPALKGDYDSIYEIVTGTAVPKADDQCGGTEELNNVYGNGLIDAYEAVMASPIGDTGSISGTVVDDAGDPLQGASVVFEGEFTRTATSGADGTYSLPVVPVGDYTATVSKFGYGTESEPVTVAADETTVFDIVLTPVPSSVVAGTVVDGSGHGWPLAATVSTTGGEVTTTTDPLTGEFEILLPVGEWELEVEADYAGYQTITVGVVSEADLVIEVPIAEGCIAPGYAYDPLGTGFEADTAPPGWTVINRGEQPWRFDDSGDRGNLTPGSGGFAIADSDEQGSGGRLMDTDLVSPVFDLSSAPAPTLAFDNDYRKGSYDTQADVSISVDGGETWEEVWAPTASRRNSSETVDLTAWADATAAQLKFHYTDNTSWAWWWEIDNVLVGGAIECAPVEGGLVRGTVTELTTGDPIDGAVVSHAYGYSGVTASDGSYWVFAPGSGPTELTATKADFGSATEEFDLVADGVIVGDFAIGTAEITVSRTTLNSYVQQGASWTHYLAVTNSGTAAGEVSFEVGDGEFAMMGLEDPSDTSWLSVGRESMVVEAGETELVAVTTTADEEFGVDQPGTYTATLSIDVVSPHDKPSVAVSMLVVPKADQGKVVGTVEAMDCDGEAAPLSDAQVQVRAADGMVWHLTSDEEGTYELWSMQGDTTLIVSKDGYAADFEEVAVLTGQSIDQSFIMMELGC